MIKWGHCTLCISWGLKLLKPQAQLCNLLSSSGSLIKIKSSPFFHPPPLPSPPPPHHHHYPFGPERNNYFWSVEETWGSRAAAAATAAALHCFKVLLLDIRAGGESKENRSYSLLEPAVAFHTDDSSIFLSSLFFCFFSRCGKDGWQKRRRKDFSVRGLCQVDAEPRSTGGCLFGL